MIEQHAAAQHADALRRAEVMRQARGSRRSRPGGPRRRLAQRLVAVAGRLDPQTPVLRPGPGAATSAEAARRPASTLVPSGPRRAA